MIGRREFFLQTLKATAAGILVPEHLLKGRSMVSLCGVEFYGVSFLEGLDEIQRALNSFRTDFVGAAAYSTAVAELFRVSKERK